MDRDKRQVFGCVCYGQRQKASEGLVVCAMDRDKRLVKVWFWEVNVEEYLNPVCLRILFTF